MSDTDGHVFSDFDCDSGLFIEASNDTLPPGALRPAKRRRLSPETTGRRAAHEAVSNSSVPATTHDDKVAARKSKIHLPKYHVDHEPVFVSQTQPPSSPSVIRGPRWKAPGRQKSILQAKRSPARAECKKQTVPDFEDELEDEDIDAAIAASLQSFKEEQWARVPVESFENPVDGPGGGLGATAHKQTPKEEASFEFDDIPDDAFDFEPEYGNTTNNNVPNLISSQQLSQKNRSRGSQNGSFRQTTLFGGFTSNIAASQPSSRSWPLASQNEPPTHHELNEEALQRWTFPNNLGRKREYQYNIAYRALFHNLLVALPTGLGKTFIAATVMLNWLHWTKSSQIVFVAPTKPLVSQQVEACFNIVGIPRSQTTLLTGNTPPGVRAEEWKSKRVFFMTPQTIMNDLKTGIADPKRIVLLVVDEAHRATGAYAYVEIVKFLYRFNKSFRVMALTATPGATVEAVQEVIDGLNISRIEIRTEHSLDIREFIHSRNVELKTFENSQEMVAAMELFSKALQSTVDKLRNQNAYWGRDPMSLTPFGLTKARQEWNNSSAGRAASWPAKGAINSLFTVLASLAHAIDLLKYHGIGPFFRNLVSFEDSVLKEKKGGRSSAQIASDGNFKILMSRLRSWTNNPDFIGHPKLEYLREAILNHFLDNEGGSDQNGEKSDSSSTRVMIFSHFRDSAEEIVRVLKRHQPMIRPHVFVGQANAKGSEGMDQKTQLAVVSKFKSGIYNTIVATSIGEEGLDIGEVDLIICYDGHSSPIRMLQRMGRTGRKRSGNIILLLSKGKEEESYNKAKDSYEKMQQLIASGKSFNFHDDKSPRIIPRAIQPEVDERVIEIPIENSQPGLPEPAKRARAPKRPPKKFHMPDDVETGFTKASRLGRTNTNSSRGSKRQKPVRSPSPELEEVPDLDDLCANQSDELAKDRDFQAIVNQPAPTVRMDAYPVLQRSLRPTRYIPHGRSTRRFVETLRKIRSISPSCKDEHTAFMDNPYGDSLDFEDLPTDREDDPCSLNTPQPREPLSDCESVQGMDLDQLILEALSTGKKRGPPTEPDINEVDSPLPSQRRKRFVISDDSDNE
ncbi:3'-5' DNA helicase [Ophidiomyces ophidiicola]|nr:3'-5' DNA helicase [Ophidiomyces ophidiicola]KAI1991300.1 3'-5' DNA helicase [Ophidiomyces ophidiicola]KAI1999285.1 3'-5' DNA helicase [Ophidiomyces ophidiicola]